MDHLQTTGDDFLDDPDPFSQEEARLFPQSASPEAANQSGA